MDGFVPDEEPTLRTFLASCQAADEPHELLLQLCDWLTQRGDPRGSLFRLQDEYWLLAEQVQLQRPGRSRLAAHQRADEVQSRIKAAWPALRRPWLPDWSGGEGDLYLDYPFLHLNVAYPPPGSRAVQRLLQAGWISSLRLGDGPELTDLPVAWFDDTGPVRHVLLDNNPAVRDADLAALQRVPCLRAVWLEGTRVSDKGLAHLHPIKTLRFVDLAGTRTTAAGAAALMAAVPGCEIEGIDGV